MKPSVYEGDKEYIFISYAHKDSEKVFPILNHLEANGYRVWYDDGIAPGSEWPENIAQHLDKADVFMAFVSPNSMDSANCRREITFALSRQIKFLSVVIEETKLPLGMELQISAQQSILRHNFHTEEEFLNKIVKAEIIRSCFDESLLKKEEPAPAPQPIPAPQPAPSQEVPPQAAPAPQNTQQTAPYTPVQPQPPQQNTPQNEKPGFLKTHKGLVAGIVVAVCVVLLIIGVVIKKLGDTPEQVSLNNPSSASSDSSNDNDDVQSAQVAKLDLPDGTPVGYSVEEVGSFDVIDNLTFKSDTALVYKGDNLIVYSADGTPVPGEFCFVQSTGNGNYIVQNADDGLFGLVSMDGELLIPYGAKNISFISNSNRFDVGRYMKVVYITGITDDPDNYIYFDGKGLSPVEGDVLYSGYIKIFDTKNGKYISDHLFDNPDASAYYECGDRVLVVNKDKSAVLMDEDGNQLTQIKDASKIDVGNGYYILRDGDSWNVYDENGNYRSSSADSLSSFNSTGGYIKRYSDGKYYLTDIDGNTVIPEGFDNITWEKYGVVEVRKEKDSALYRTNGDCLCEFEGTSTSSEYFSAFTEIAERKKRYLYGYNGAVVEKYEYTVERGALMFLDGLNALVMNDGSSYFALEGNNIKVFKMGLGAVKSDKSGKYGLFDFYTGEKLLDYQYSEIIYVNGYIFARNLDTWTTYKVNFLFSGSEEKEDALDNDPADVSS